MKLRMIVAGIIVTIAVVGVAINMVRTWMFGQGEVHILAGGSDTTVTYDGERLGQVDAGTTGIFLVAQGEHVLALSDATGESSEQSVHVDGWTEVIVAAPGLCVARLDVTNGLYNDKEPNWSLKGWHAAGEIATMPHNGGTSFTDLPDEIRGASRAELLIAVPCGLEGEADAIRALAQMQMQAQIP